MRPLPLSAAAFGALICAAAPALAWSDRVHGQSTAAMTPPIYAYPTSENYCPTGLQPVVVGGVICCGRPTHIGYRPDHHPRKRYKAASGTYVATGKGYGEGYYK